MLMRPVATWNTTASREILVRHTRKPIAEMLSTLVSGLVVLIAPVILLIGCGGGSSAGGGQTALGTPAISSVTVSCATTIIMTSQSGQCSAAVAGTGNYSSAVNWLVNNVIGGNATVGTISSAGLYSAPVTVPTPYTVTVTATSVSDITKSASSAILIAGTIAATPQLISAASGGTITVPDGSSVTIPADFLPADQTVTLSEMSILPQQPPDGFVTGVGTALRLTFSTPVKPLFRGSDERAENNSAIGLAMPRANTLSTVSFAISQEPATSGLTGAIGMVAVADSTNAISFLPINYSTIGPSSSFAFQASLLVGLQNPISSISVSAANNTFLVIPTGLPLTSLPKSLCWQSGSQTWSDFSTCSGQVTGQRVLVVVHGMMSCVENTYTPLAKYMQAIVPPPPAKPYGAIVGFDYDWTQHLKITNGVSGSGDQLVSLLEQIAQLKPSSIDIVAHSEGVPVSLYAASVMPMPDRTLIANFFGLAGPVLGTPVSEAGWADLAIYAKYFFTASSSCPSSTAIQNLGLDALFQSSFIQDLQPNSTSVNGIVQDVAAKLGGTNTRIFLAGGTNQNLGRWPVTLGNIYSTTGSPFGLTPNDGIVGLDSALAYGAGFAVYPFPPFTALTHTDLPDDPLVMEYIGKQVSGTASPHLTCLNTAGACRGPQNTQFTIAGTGFGTNSQNVQVYGQDSTGTVTQFQTSGLLDSAGTISWQVPIGIQSTGMFSVFAFDSTLSLASNNVTQTIVPAITLTISPTVATLAPGGTQNFSAAVAGNSNTGVTWSVQEGTAGGSINSGGLYTAPLVSGVYHVIATSQANTGVTSSAVVTVSGSYSTITISPTSATVPEGAGQTFTAVVSSGGGVDWSVQEAAGGTITSSGIYTAPQIAGTFHVIATNVVNSSQTATATVTVVGNRAFSVVYSFTAPSNGYFFQNGASPNTLLQGNDGNLYGTANGGGNYGNYSRVANCFNYGCGTIFSSGTTGNLTLLRQFAGIDGGMASGALIQGLDGAFYGTTTGGGASSTCAVNGGVAACGVVFRVNNTGTYTILHSFNALDGAFPQGGVIQASDGNFYGTTFGGGNPASCPLLQTPGCGTIFKMDSSGNVTTLHSFSVADGMMPMSKLTQATDGALYGTTAQGGSNNEGTIFRIDLLGNFTSLHSFAVTDGDSPYAGLVQATDGNLYGTTWAGGSSNAGVVFRMSLSGNLAVLKSLESIGKNTQGSNVAAALVQASDGFLYGTTDYGGASNSGVVFRLDLSGNFTVIHSFSGPDGANPDSGLIESNGGVLYGTTQSGGSGWRASSGSNGGGVIFALSP